MWPLLDSRCPNSTQQLCLLVAFSKFLLLPNVTAVMEIISVLKSLTIRGEPWQKKSFEVSLVRVVRIQNKVTMASLNEA